MNATSNATLYASLLLLAAFLAVVWWWVPIWQVHRVRLTVRDAKARAELEDNFRKTLGQLIGGAAILVAALFAYYQAQLTVSASRDLLISQQVSKGFEQLGSNAAATRLGGVYALEGVMNTSREYHRPIVEALSAVLRVESPANAASDALAPVAATIVTVLGRRNESIGSGDEFGSTTVLDLNNTNLRWADLRNAHLAGADLTGSDLTKAHLPKADLSGARLSRATLADADLNSANLTGANLSGAHMSVVQLPNADLSRADLSFAQMPGANLVGANLSNAKLTTAMLVSARLIGATLIKATLSYAMMDDADFSKANLRDANLRDANLSGAKNLADANLSGACGNAQTKLPPGITINLCQ
jgi:uncharacterized protein YjbI with pentapeptide repeats